MPTESSQQIPNQHKARYLIANTTTAHGDYWICIQSNFDLDILVLNLILGHLSKEFIL